MTTTSDQVLLDAAPPRDLNAERALIGAVLCGMDALPPLLAEEFDAEGHRAIWAACQEIEQLDGRATLVAVVAELRRRGQLESVGGPAHLALCVEEGCTLYPVTGAARIIRDAARARAMMSLGAALIADGLSRGDVEARLAAMPGTVARAIWDPGAAWDRIRARWGEARIRTGWLSLDDVTGGFAPGELIVVGGRTSHGKALALDTPLPTPSGWTTMGAVRAGDRLLGANGRPVMVCRVSEIMEGRPCFSVAFSDGTTILSDADHLWLTESRAARRSAAAAINRVRTSPFSRDQRRLAVLPAVRTTREIAETLHARGYRNHAISTCAPIVLPERALPVPPYVLGVWLGDGTSADGAITALDRDVLARIEAAGQEARQRAGSQSSPRCPTYGLPGLKVRLRALGVLNNKHLPDVYLRASESQRREVLAGLLDSDGTVNVDGSVGLDVTREALARTAYELICSLGYRPSMSQRSVAGASSETSTCFRIRFATSEEVFHLPRKAERLRALRATRRVRHRTDRRTIVSVTSVPSVSVCCLQVDAPDGLYLAGRSFIPTHNTAFACASAIHLAQRGVSVDILTLEDPVESITRRLVSNLTGIAARRLGTGLLGPLEEEAAARAIDGLTRLPLTVTGVDRHAQATEEGMLGLLAACRGQVVILDHLQRVQTKDVSRAYALERVLGRIHGHVQRTSQVAWVNCQLNREVEARKDGRPTLADLRDSGAIEILARQIWLLSWPVRWDAKRDWRDYLVDVAKNSEGPVRKVAFQWEPASGQFWTADDPSSRADDAPAWVTEP